MSEWAEFRASVAWSLRACSFLHLSLVDSAPTAGEAEVEKRERDSPNPVLFCHLFWRGAPVLKRKGVIIRQKTGADINTVPIIKFMLGLLFSIVRSVIIFTKSHESRNLS